MLSIFIKADMQDRIRRIAKLYDLSDAKAKDKITKIDKQRARLLQLLHQQTLGRGRQLRPVPEQQCIRYRWNRRYDQTGNEVKEAGIRKIFSI